MNRKEFMSELDRRLSKIPQSERHEIISDFEEHFEVGAMDGKTEDAVAEELGSPKVIARDLLVDYRVHVAETDKSVTNITRAIIAAVALSFLNLIFLLGPIIAIISVYVAFVAVGVAFAVSPLFWIVSLILGQGIDLLAEFFIMLTMSSLGVLICIGMFYVGKFLYQVILKYVKFNIQIVKGRTE